MESYHDFGNLQLRWARRRGRVGRKQKRPRETQALGYDMVPRDGIEPPTRGFSVLCSTD